MMSELAVRCPHQVFSKEVNMIPGVEDLPQLKWNSDLLNQMLL